MVSEFSQLDDRNLNTLQSANQMDGSGTPTESWRPYLTARVLPAQTTNDQAELVNRLPDVNAGESAAFTGKKRKGRKPTQTPEERKRKKIASDQNYRKGLKNKLERLTKIASDFGGIDEMESVFQRLKQLKSKHGGFEEIVSKLNMLEQMEAELSIFHKVKAMFEGIDNILPGLDRLKKTEFQHAVSVFKPNQTERQLVDFLPPSPDFLQVQDNHGAQSVNPNNQRSTGETDLLGVEDFPFCHMFLIADTLYSDVVVTDFISTLEKNTRSNVNFDSFKDLNGERQRVGDYSFPMSLVSTAQAIIDNHGDVTKNCLSGPTVVGDTYILLCAAIKEMGDVSLKQVTEEILFKWRDAIKDAKRIGCEVEFAWKHLETIAYAYFWLIAQNDCASLELRVANLMAQEKYFRQVLEKTVDEVKAVRTKEEVLTSPLCKSCQDFANRFQDKNVGPLG